MRLLAVCLGVALVVATWCQPARAAESCTWGVLTVGSKHFGENRDRKGREIPYEEENWGLGVEHCIGTVGGLNVRAIAGAYRNSIRRDSAYMGFAAPLWSYGPVSLMVAGVLVSGYEIEPLIAPVPAISIEGRSLGLNLSFVPKTQHNPPVVGLQLKYRFL